MPEQTQGDCRNDAGREGGCGLAATGLARGPTRRRCHAWWEAEGIEKLLGRTTLARKVERISDEK